MASRSISLLTHNCKQLGILIGLLTMVSCLPAATPDDDLVSGIVSGDMAAVQQALERGANVNSRYKNGQTPLMYACKELKQYHGEADSGVTATVTLDLKNVKTSVDLKADRGHISRSSQTTKGNRAIVELLLARGAEVNAKDNDGRTPLGFARQHNLSEIVAVLKKAGATE